MALRLDTAVAQIQKRIAKLKRSVKASEFRPELERFARSTLQDCINATPARSETLIAVAQAKQYNYRINFIPSAHELSDPSLRINDDGTEWIFSGAKWYRGDWNLPDNVWNDYQGLIQERERRMQTAPADFIAERKQARFLYKKSWVQVATSLGFGTEGGSAILASHSRRKPVKEPPRGYGQWRGGQTVLSIVVFNPFLDVATNSWMKTWEGNGKAILAQATAKNRARFFKEVQDKLKRSISEARQTV